MAAVFHFAMVKILGRLTISILSGLYHCAKFGCIDRFGYFDNTKV